MSIVRLNKKRNPYVSVDKTPFQDTSLTWQEKGVMAYLLTKPDNWTVMMKDLERQTPDVKGQGREALQRILKNLEKAGYILRRREKNDKGQFKKWDTIVFETPQDRDEWMQQHSDERDNPQSGIPDERDNPQSGIPDVGYPVHIVNKEDLVIKDLSTDQRKEITPLTPQGGNASEGVKNFQTEETERSQEVGDRNPPPSSQQAEQSGERKQGKSSARRRASHKNQTSDQILALLEEPLRDRFDKFWTGYSAFCTQRQAKTGPKKAAVIAWKFLAESDFNHRGLDAFNEGVKVFVRLQGDRTAGIPHASRFLYSSSNGSGAWEDALEQSGRQAQCARRVCVCNRSRLITPHLHRRRHFEVPNAVPAPQRIKDHIEQLKQSLARTAV